MQLSQFYSHFGIWSHVTSGVFDRCAVCTLREVRESESVRLVRESEPLCDLCHSPSVALSLFFSPSFRLLLLSSSCQSAAFDK